MRKGTKRLPENRDDNLRSAMNLIEDLLMKVANIGAALSKIGDCNARDCLICDMDTKCAWCRHYWQRLCALQDFDPERNPFDEEFNLPPFNAFAGGNSSQTFIELTFIELLREVFDAENFAKPLFIWDDYCVAIQPPAGKQSR